MDMAIMPAGEVVEHFTNVYCVAHRHPECRHDPAIKNTLAFVQTPLASQMILIKQRSHVFVSVALQLLAYSLKPYDSIN